MCKKFKLSTTLPNFSFSPDLGKLGCEQSNSNDSSSTKTKEACQAFPNTGKRSGYA